MNRSIKINWNTKDLWKGCILTSIAHAMMVAYYPELSHENSWDGMNYNVQDSAGARGTVTFHANYCVGAFRSEHSNRVRSKNLREAESYFSDAPVEIRRLAKSETLEYLLDDIDNQTRPVITTAFWGIGENLYSSDSFETMMENGGFLLSTQTMDLHSAVKELSEDYEMTSKQIEVLWDVFKVKSSKRSNQITLSKEEVFGTDDLDPEGLLESKISFQEIGIKLIGL